MFAVLHHIPDATWADINDVYRESPLYTLDKSVQGFLQHQPQQQPVDLVEVDDVDSAIYEDLPRRGHATSRHALAVKCREKLDLLRDLSYLCTDTSILASMEDKLDLLLVTTQLRLQDQSGHIEAPAPKKSKARKRKRPNPEHGHSLPSRKIKNPMQIVKMLKSATWALP